MLRFLLFMLLVYAAVRVAKILLGQQATTHRQATVKRPDAAARTPYEVLGVGQNASQEEIRAAYQQRIRESHPDRVADMSKEIREVAEQQAKEINAAYNQIKSLKAL